MAAAKKPKVSVVMPVYNGESYLREAVASILNQTHTDFELIIINDGSSDSTPAILEEIRSDNRVKVLTNEVNSGLTFTRNKGIEASSGQYVAMLDSDDVAYPKRLEKQVLFLDANTDFALVGSCIDLVESDGRYIRTQLYPTPPEYIPSLLLFQNNFAQSTVMIRKEALSNLFYRPAYPPAEDYDLWVRIAARHKVANLNERMVKYRIHGSSISTLKANIQKESIKKIVSGQLANIGVLPNAHELELHTQIGILEVPSTKTAVQEAEAWLLKLVAANRTAKYYPRSVFESIVAQKWYEVCHNSNLGNWAYSTMVGSALFNMRHAAYILRTKLVSKVRANT